jgi:hypothetical protein
MHPALTRRPEIRVRRSSKIVSPCADGQRPSSLIGPAPRRNVRYGVPLGGVVFAGYWREVMWNRPRSRSATRCGRTECREIRYCRRSPPAGRPRRRAGLPRRQGDCRRGCACARGRRASRRCSRRLLLRSLGRLIAGVLAVPADAGAHFLPRESVGEPFMTPKTVEARRLRIRRKLGVRSRAELARKPARPHARAGSPVPGHRRCATRYDIAPGLASCWKAHA